jgi:hypothetical protein
MPPRLDRCRAREEAGKAVTQRAARTTGRGISRAPQRLPSTLQTTTTSPCIRRSARFNRMSEDMDIPGLALISTEWAGPANHAGNVVACFPIGRAGRPECQVSPSCATPPGGSKSSPFPSLYCHDVPLRPPQPPGLHDVLPTQGMAGAPTSRRPCPGP